ncbi:mitochondrial 54S ribosomal protein bL32m [Aspergillus melleus]|uniref:mitochondrial 54S ribosomal protein bL32m n=1 Tax=Aspergillus melleus TaxID=138277 RepID=UPI001E8EC9C8|nr:Ski complex subunit Rec14 [Aspergillus melleus]KAH8425684.1 Ski complex subunit Rec14 [Aspergillus melleus]
MASPTMSIAAGRWSRVLLGSTLAQNPWRPAAFALNVPGLLSGIWDSVLRAVPKKKTSHMKKRHRQMAGKALKDVKNLNTCPGCGQIKRAHVLCPHCVASMSSSSHVTLCHLGPQSNRASVSRYQEGMEQYPNGIMNIKTTRRGKI